MKYTMTIERDEDESEELYIIIKNEDYFQIRLAFYPRKIDNFTFALCHDATNITVKQFEDFIEIFEQNEYCTLDIDGRSTNNIVHHPNMLYILKWYKDYLNISIPVDQDTRSNFVIGFKKFLGEVKEICNIH